MGKRISDLEGLLEALWCVEEKVTDEDTIFPLLSMAKKNASDLEELYAHLYGNYTIADKGSQ